VCVFYSNQLQIFRVLEAVGSSLVHTYQSTRSHKLEGSFIDTEWAMSVYIVKLKVRSQECAFLILTNCRYSGEAVGSSLVHTYQTTRSHKLEGSFIDTEWAMSVYIVKLKVRSQECAFLILTNCRYSGWWRQWVPRWYTPTRLHDLINWRVTITSPAEVTKRSEKMPLCIVSAMRISRISLGYTVFS
jgi:hypothetical protein